MRASTSNCARPPASDTPDLKVLTVSAAAFATVALRLAPAQAAAFSRGLPADVPATPDAEEARRAAQEELSKAVYQQRESLLSRALRWLFQHLDPSEVVPAVPEWLSILLVIVIVAALLVAIILLLTRVTAARRSRNRADLLFEDDRDAATLTRAANEAADRGDWVTAVVERFRAIIRSLDERGAIEDYPGMTAHEAAHLAGYAVGPLAGDLREGADLFDAVRYGHVVSAPSQDAWMRDLAERVARAPLAEAAEVMA